MSSPFDDADGVFLVVVDDEGRHSLWPLFAPVPAGWTTVHGPAGHEDCLDYVQRSWTGLGPLSPRWGRA
ncbi:MbtH family protein [Actinomadura craniellae]|uniref:MbtH family protein n=1 Tax=Actinomadura craniellae TaxID=2231787 RepID=A0A365H0R5_9ACTN|nr:MbtH family protein [Actinomadura craniellae]RAY12674.1 MbtH family protein [Actinomadura craniellae]